MGMPWACRMLLAPPPLPHLDPSLSLHIENDSGGDDAILLVLGQS